MSRVRSQKVRLLVLFALDSEGARFSFAEEIGATKLALGHHMDDMVETLFLNMFFQAQLKGMPPKLLSDDKRNIVIRPLAYCREKDIAKGRCR